MVGRWNSLWDDLFSKAMWVSGSVYWIFKLNAYIATPTWKQVINEKSRDIINILILFELRKALCLDVLG